MSKRITFVAATEKEIGPLLHYLKMHAEQQSFQTYLLHGLQVDILISGIGVLQTTYSLMDYISHRHPDLWIQAGIGGAFDPSLETGKVYQINSEILVGFGAEDPEGKILDQFTLGWSDSNAFPYAAGKLECPYLFALHLPLVTGMTTFYAHGHQGNIETLRQQPNGQMEDMEGVPFFYISLIRKIPFVSIRSVSNFVSKRDKASWKIDEAVASLNEVLIRSLGESGFNADKLIRSNML
jgi:futalosine hydrolase